MSHTHQLFFFFIKTHLYCLYSFIIHYSIKIHLKIILLVLISSPHEVSNLCREGINRSPKASFLVSLASPLKYYHHLQSYLGYSSLPARSEHLLPIIITLFRFLIKTGPAHSGGSCGISRYQKSSRSKLIKKQSSGICFEWDIKHHGMKKSSILHMWLLLSTSSHGLHLYRPHWP